MKKYFIDELDVSKEEFYDNLEEELLDYCTENYDDMIDDTNEIITVFGMTYQPSTVLKKLDPIAYRCGLSDYHSYELENAQYELEQGEELEVNNFYFRIEEKGKK